MPPAAVSAPYLPALRSTGNGLYEGYFIAIDLPEATRRALVKAA